jgi:NAD(P)H-dependent nitrite reductase small subunit
MKEITVRYSGKNNEGQLVLSEGQEIALFRVDGRYHAIENRCPHRGGYLADGIVRDGQVRCPLHGWGFDLATGACATRPGEEVRCFDVRELSGDEVVISVP